MKLFKKGVLLACVAFTIFSSKTKAYMLIGPNQPKYALKDALVTNYGTAFAPNYKINYCNIAVTYKSLIDQTSKKWDALGKVAISSTGTLCNLADATVFEYAANDINMGLTSMENRTIKFNTTRFAHLTADQRVKVILHEFGHALGLDHREDTESVMQQGQWNYTTIQSADKTLYNTIWSKNYPVLKSVEKESVIRLKGSSLFLKDDYNGLYDFANVVLVATIKNELANDLEGELMPQSLYELNIEKIYKNNNDSVVDQVYRNGGYNQEQQLVVVDDNELLETGKKYLLFIATQDDGTQLILTYSGSVEVNSINEADRLLGRLIED